MTQTVFDSESKIKMQKEKTVYLSQKAGYLWVLINAVGINLALIFGSILASNRATYLTIIALVGMFFWFGQWFFLRMNINQSWRWVSIGIGGWLLSFGIITGMYLIALASLNEATEQLGGVIDTMLFILIVLSVGPIVMIALLILADMYLKMVK